MTVFFDVDLKQISGSGPFFVFVGGISEVDLWLKIQGVQEGLPVEICGKRLCVKAIVHEPPMIPVNGRPQRCHVSFFWDSRDPVESDVGSEHLRDMCCKKRENCLVFGWKIEGFS